MKNKLYLFVDEEYGCPQRLIQVENFDDGFAALLTKLNDQWVETDEEYFDFVFRGLRTGGYKFTELEYETFKN